MSSPPRQQRSKRSNSVYAFSANTILNTIKAKIKHIDEKSSSNKLGAGCTVAEEEMFIKKKNRKFRRVFLTDHNYKIGWVVDSDFSFCMICCTGFGWLTLKHHCRACGLLVCASCTPYTAAVTNLFEEGGSRVCVNCFGLRVQEPGSPTVNSSYNSRSTYNYDHLEEANRPSIGNRMVVSRTELSLDTMDVDMDVDEKERAMIPLYEEAYNTMRQFIPLDIFRISYEQLLAYGLPDAIAERIWNNKILWLIVMHPDDIAKLHLAELRTKYLAENLDIIELRAVWYNVPGWDVDENNGTSRVLQAGKNKWRAGLKARLNQLTELEERGQLMRNQMRNDVYDGFDDKYLFDPEISLIHESEMVFRDGYGNPLSIQYSHSTGGVGMAGGGGGAMYGSAPAGSVLTSLLTPAENLYGSRYSNTSTTHDAIADAMYYGGAAVPNTTGKLPRAGLPQQHQQYPGTVQRNSLVGQQQQRPSGGGRQQILLSDEDDTVYPPVVMSASLPNHMSNGYNHHLMNNSAFNSPSHNNNGRYDPNLSMNSDTSAGYRGNGMNDSYLIERDNNYSSDYYVGGSQEGPSAAASAAAAVLGGGFESPTPAALQAGFNEAEMHQQYASKVLNENTNRVLSQYYQQQYEEQQLKLKLQQEQKEKLEREAAERAALSAAKKKHHHTNTGSRSRTSTPKSSSTTPKK